MFYFAYALLTIFTYKNICSDLRRKKFRYKTGYHREINPILTRQQNINQSDASIACWRDFSTFLCVLDHGTFFSRQLQEECWPLRSTRCFYFYFMLQYTVQYWILMTDWHGMHRLQPAVQTYHGSDGCW